MSNAQDTPNMSNTTAITLFRSEHPSSRAVKHWCHTGGSVQRRATCIYCRRTLATCSAKWPATKQFLAAAESHMCDIRLLYEVRAAASFNSSTIC